MRIRQIVLLLFILIAVLPAKEILIGETVYLPGGSVTESFFPSYSNDGNSILFTQQGYAGLWLLDRVSLSSKQITAASGSGFQPISLRDGSVIFRSDRFQSGRKYTALVKYHDQQSTQLYKETRFLSPGSLVDDKIITLANNKLITINAMTNQVEPSAESSISLINDQLTLKLLKNGRLTEIAPMGEGNYIWGSLSPRADKIVFTLTGRGSYISNLEGQELISLGEAHSPQWSPDGLFIVYMKDLDDGDQYIASEIWVATADGNQAWMVTDTPDRIEMYPQWSPDGQQIIYHTPAGEIFETHIRIVE